MITGWLKQPICQPQSFDSAPTWEPVGSSAAALGVLTGFTLRKRTIVRSELFPLSPASHFLHVRDSVNLVDNLFANY